MKQAPTSPPKRVREPAEPAAARRASRLVLQFAVLMVLTLVLQTFHLPWRLLTIVVGIAAIIQGIRALRATWKAKVRGLIVPALVIGIVMTVLTSFSTVILLFVWQIEMDLQECQQGAITVSARDQCAADYKTQLDDWRKSIEEKAKSLS